MSIKDTPLRFYLLIMLGFWTCTNNNISAEHQNVLKDLGNRSRIWQESTNDYGMKVDSEALKESFVNYRLESGKKHEKKIKSIYDFVLASVESSKK